MRSKISALAMFFVLLIPSSACSGDKGEKPKGKSILMPVVAGAFYTADASVLEKEVDGFIAAAPKKTYDGNIIGIISPHAGYRYSGQVAGAAFRQIQGMRYNTVIVMAPSHRVPVSGVAFPTKDVYRTPLGDIPIDVEKIRRIVGRYKWAAYDDRPYEVEHSMEVQLPFLQRVTSDFMILPMIIGAHDQATLDAIATALEVVFPGEEVLFVASSDLSHYLPYEKAVDADKKTMSLVCDASATAYYDAVKKGDASLCGSSPVYILKRIAESRKAKLGMVEYANSGDTYGDKSRVVGYGAVVAVAGADSSLGEVQKEELLKLSRVTLEAFVRGKKVPPLPVDAALKKDGAAFVTLRKRGELRGCIGQIIARMPLDECIRDMTISAASEDPRFPPVKADELKDIDIEISVLTPPKPMDDPMSVRVGTDGLIISKGFNRGVLLPQVPIEQGWNKNQYLEGICHKAGMAPSCWKDASLSRFQAIVFGEK